MKHTIEAKYNRAASVDQMIARYNFNHAYLKTQFSQLGETESLNKLTTALKFQCTQEYYNIFVKFK